MSTAGPDPTAEYRTPSDGGLRATNRPPVALVLGSAATTPELPGLLRGRLRFAALIFAGVYGLSLLVNLRYLAGRTGLAAWEAASTATLVLAVLVSVGVAGGCAYPQWWTLRRLRVAEAALFGTVLARNLHRAVLFPSWSTLWNRAAGFLAEGQTTQAIDVFDALSAEFIAPWMLLVVTYGVLIPNPGRRAAVVVGAMTALALGCWAALGPAVGIPLELWLRVVVFGYAVLLPAVAAVAVFASYRTDQYRRQSAVARRLGQYHLRRKLGSGGMGEVFLAEHVLLRRPCAVKVIRPDRAGDPQTLARFEREVQLTAALTHPNTVQVYDYGRADDGTFYYAMEYLPGRNLDELVAAAGPLPPARAIHFLRQLCGALAEAHAAGLIHRDIKPSNVIAGERGGVCDVAKLLDFGLVRAERRWGTGDLTAQGVVTGTPAYLSPEQAAGDARIDARSDVYSLGALAYFLLAGSSPFAGRTPMRMIAAHLSEPPPPLADVPADLEAVVMRCLGKKPADRFPDVRALDAALAGCAAAGGWTAADAAAWWKGHPTPPPRPPEPTIDSRAETHTPR